MFDVVKIKYLSMFILKLWWLSQLHLPDVALLDSGGGQTGKNPQCRQKHPLHLCMPRDLMHTWKLFSENRQMPNFVFY